MEKSKLVSILNYWGIGLIIYFFFAKELQQNPYVQFHAKQWMLLLLLSIGISIIFGMLYFLYFIYHVVKLVLFAASVYWSYNAFSWKTEEIPFIWKYADKLTFM